MGKFLNFLFFGGMDPFSKEDEKKEKPRKNNTINKEKKRKERKKYENLI